ncbi:MAG: cell shape determination protein CcmA [Candidatus Neomarinimicrobiota bacterium]|nr:MAG: cell shape determination protein CcmA [Candidatus Neomarinimicrobiota bacterium]RKY53740.1 MAG: cell shape determination protein CcmA [Candidatus Neomarinimicrobiota bacterium]
MIKGKETAVSTIIGEGTTLEGNINMDGNIIIYGNIIGDIETKGTITVAAGAKIKGKLIGTDILISGNVEGNIYAVGKVALSNRANLYGDVTAKSIAIEEGAKFEGRCDMKGYKFPKEATNLEKK